MFKNMLLLILVTLTLVGKDASAYFVDLSKDVTECVPDCDSQVFCQGELLHDVQLSRVFHDGTVFVEKKLLYPENVVVEKYRRLKRKVGGVPSVKVLRNFVDENFANDSLDTCELVDYKPVPNIVNKVNPKYKQWLTRLNEIWLELAGRTNKDCSENPGLHSYLAIPHRFIKAGGRFTGTYYWDSYWIIKGLLVCDMHETARGIIENIVSLIYKHGHMPNGNRIYYLQRSQPPMLIQMAAAYYDVTKNNTFIKQNLRAFEKEFHWWYKNRSVIVEKNGKRHKMFRYKSVSCSPRPESYYEDYTLVQNVTDIKERMRIFTGIRSAAESGWDFSSRHMRGVNNSKLGTLRDMDSQNMVYVDLNSIIYSNAIYLSQWQKQFGSVTMFRFYEKLAKDLLTGIEQILWNKDAGVWQDFDLITDKHRNYFFPTNLTPLWAGAYTKTEYVESAIKYVIKEEIIHANFTPRYYGIPTSMDRTSEQWDFPNCWAPLQAFVIQGFDRTNHPTAKIIAYNLAKNWIQTMYEGYQNATYMYEKYSALNAGSTGAGGEYEPQTGFGWTNGFCFEIFSTWKID